MDNENKLREKPIEIKVEEIKLEYKTFLKKSSTVEHDRDHGMGVFFKVEGSYFQKLENRTMNRGENQINLMS